MDRQGGLGGDGARSPGVVLGAMSGLGAGTGAGEHRQRSGRRSPGTAPPYPAFTGRPDRREGWREGPICRRTSHHLIQHGSQAEQLGAASSSYLHSPS